MEVRTQPSLVRHEHQPYRRFRLDELRVFGSFAAGRPHEGSDIDLLPIGPFAGKLPHRIIEVLHTTELPIQPLCYTPDEWKAMLAGGNTLAGEIARTSIVLPRD